MSLNANVVRQWVALQGGSCDLRIGQGAIDAMGNLLKSTVGKPRRCLLVATDDLSPELVESVRRQLSDTGFEVSHLSLPLGPSLRTLASAERLCEALAQAKVTADDLVCAIGASDLLSVCSFVCADWCGNTPLVHVATDLTSAIEMPATPRGIDVAGHEQMLSVHLGAKYVVCDLDVAAGESSTPDAINLRAVMATSAICDGEAAVQRLWDRAELLVEGDLEIVRDQAADTAKSRGRIVSSAAIATRQSIDFGQTFTRALSRLVGDDVPRGLLLAEAVRFQARIAAATDVMKVEDVLTIDELLELLELPPVACDVDPDEMVAALKNERFERSMRFVLCLPRGFGRVRPSSVEDEVLREHAQAWSASRRALLGE